MPLAIMLACGDLDCGCDCKRRSCADTFPRDRRDRTRQMPTPSTSAMRDSCIDPAFGRILVESTMSIECIWIPIRLAAAACKNLMRLLEADRLKQGLLPASSG